MTEEKKKIGRPTNYTLELAEEICDAISSDSKGLKRLCSDHPHWPDRMVIYQWIRKHSEFHIMYMKAKESQIEAIVDDILDISDDTSHDKIIKIDADGNEKEVCNSEYVNRSRLRVDSRKWLSSKLCPKIYGDRVQHGPDENAQPFMDKIMDKL